MVGSSHEDCKKKIDFVIRMLKKLGFLINYDKSVTEPSQKVTYLGFQWDTVLWKVSLKPAREEKLRDAATFLRVNKIFTCRKVSSFIGAVQSTAGAVPLARARVRRVQWEFLASCKGEEDYDDLMYLSEDAKAELEFWETLKPGISSPITLPMADQTMDTDASDYGVGMYFQGRLLSESVPEGHINVTELWALGRALQKLRNELKPGPLTWRVDNDAARCAIRNEGSTKSWQLSCLAVETLLTAERMGIVIVPVRVSSEENNLADAASRFRRVEDWSLKEGAVLKIFNRFGTPDIDLMASQASRKVPFFISWNKSDTEAVALDALAQDVDWNWWERPYCFPPFPLISAVLQKARAQEVRVLTF